MVVAMMLLDFVWVLRTQISIAALACFPLVLDCLHSRALASMDQLYLLGFKIYLHIFRMP